MFCSASKSEVMLFTRKHERPPILVRIGPYVLPQMICFKYLGIFFDSGLRWSYHVKYVRVNLWKPWAGVSWGPHPSCLILLYRGLIGSVLEYGSVCFANTASTHILGREKVQYGAFRIALDLLKSTPNNCLGVLGGIPSLVDRLAHLNFRYFVAAFYRLGHPLRERFGALNMGCCIKGYSDVLSLDIVPSESFTRHELPALLGTPLVDGHMKKNLKMFMRRCIHWWHPASVGAFGYKIQGPAGVFTADLNALFTALRHIARVIRPRERCLILTDSLSSIKAMLSRKIAHQTHPLVSLNGCKQLCRSLC
jgi:hypothetical protein